MIANRPSLRRCLMTVYDYGRFLPRAIALVDRIDALARCAI
jgi:hypothetical protein